MDAYTGKVTLYAWDDSDPMLEAWRSAFPGTVLDKDQIPADLLPHLRYPEDMFKVQRYQYARYHVTDASDFYPANNQWAVPEDPVRTGKSQTPIRMYSRDPENGKQVWSLTLQLRAAQQVQPRRRRGRRLRPDVRGLRQDPRRGAAQRERARPDAGLQQPDLRPADHAGDAEVQARRRHDAVRQRDVRAARRPA